MLSLVQDTLIKCGNRTVVFNNWVEDEEKLSKKREELLSLVETVVEVNGGKPYTNDLFYQIKVSQVVFTYFSNYITLCEIV